MEGALPPQTPKLREIEEARADVRARVRGRAVPEHAEQPAVLVLAVVTTNEQHNSRRIVVATIAYIGGFAT